MNQSVEIELATFEEVKHLHLADSAIVIGIGLLGDLADRVIVDRRVLSHTDAEIAIGVTELLTLQLACTVSIIQRVNSIDLGSKELVVTCIPATIIAKATCISKSSSVTTVKPSSTETYTASHPISSTVGISISKTISATVIDDLIIHEFDFTTTGSPITVSVNFIEYFPSLVMIYSVGMAHSGEQIVQEAMQFSNP